MKKAILIFCFAVITVIVFLMINNKKRSSWNEVPKSQDVDIVTLNNEQSPIENLRVEEMNSVEGLDEVDLFNRAEKKLFIQV